MLAHCPSFRPLSHAVWIDLLEPTDEERSQVERALELRMPARAQLEEIESSSRAFIEKTALYLSTPVLEGSDCRNEVLTTVGFVLSKKTLVTLRFAQIAGFDAVRRSAEQDRLGANDILLRLLEAIVDHTADALEHASVDLEQISSATFHAERPRRRQLKTASDELYAGLRKLGKMADRASRLRDTLLGVGRIATFALEADEGKRFASGSASLQVVRRDVSSLSDYHAHLSGKIQFLLDATLGFISIQQNDIVKALTIASVVGVPPVLIVGIYGMNFKHMPELDWALGYPFALILLVLSALLPLGWFKWRGWM
ncbi:MAG TPA: CorA family divalent cation transporter [Polyangiaceae bacterium]|nr:CorA family divalent cation transporter [Polyangiaceae bacterium]